jgi:AmpD protein
MRDQTGAAAARLAIDSATGRVAGARQCPSPNWDERPPGGPIDLVVVHGISLPPGEFGGPWIESLFTNSLPADGHPYFAEVAGLRVSAHLLVRRDGEIVQFVPLLRRAWHAGASQWQGREACNDYSIGIELEGTDTLPYEPVQYRRLAELLNAIMAAYPGVSEERIVGHSDVAPGRKTDPGLAFDWPGLRARLVLLRELGP